jgi:hypothetical protein
LIASLGLEIICYTYYVPMWMFQYYSYWKEKPLIVYTKKKKKKCVANDCYYVQTL